MWIPLQHVQRTAFNVVLQAAMLELQEFGGNVSAALEPGVTGMVSGVDCALIT